MDDLKHSNYDMTIQSNLAQRPPFVGRYYYYAGKKYLFTHRHPYKQEYWSDEVPVTSGRHLDYGAWIPTDKLMDPKEFNKTRLVRVK